MENREQGCRDAVKGKSIVRYTFSSTRYIPNLWRQNIQFSRGGDVSVKDRRSRRPKKETKMEEFCDSNRAGVQGVRVGFSPGHCK